MSVVAGRTDCGCACHRMPGVKHMVACCAAPTYEMKQRLDERLKRELEAHGVPGDVADDLISYAYLRAERLRVIRGRKAKPGKVLWTGYLTTEELKTLRDLVASRIVAKAPVPKELPKAVLEQGMTKHESSDLWPLHTMLSEALTDQERFGEQDGG